MDIFNRVELRTLLNCQRSPRVSLYMPTRRGGSEQDPIRFRGCLDEAKSRLADAGLSASASDSLLAPLQALQKDKDFWKHQGDGLAIFAAPEFLRIYRLPIALTQLVTIGKQFTVRPLLPLISGDGCFFVLALSQNAVRLLQGTRDTVREIDLKGVPKDLATALAAHDVDEVLTYHTVPGGRRGSWTAVYHGHGVGIDDAKDDLLRYFQRIDKGLHSILTDERSPLVLAAVEHLQPIYRQANSYAHLTQPGIAGNPEHLSREELHDRAWKLVQPLFDTARQRSVALYEQLAGTGRVTNDLESVLIAALHGEIQTLFVASDAQVWGQFDESTQRAKCRQKPEPGDDDLIEYAVVQTLLKGHEVYAVAADQVPGGGPIAAIFHLPLAKRGSHRMQKRWPTARVS